MSETKWTRGPWFLNVPEPGDKELVIETQDVRVWVDFDDVNHTLADATAHLIAAAPDLYEALKELADLMRGVIAGDYTPDSFTLQPADAALGRARGEQS